MEIIDTLVDIVIDQIAYDLKDGELTALVELLEKIPAEDLVDYLRN
jgi:hypothetical protein